MSAATAATPATLTHASPSATEDCPSSWLVRTIAEEVEDRVAKAGGPRPIRVEGRNDLQWVLLDYGDLVVHVFLEETRQYYDLERLWSDVPRVAWEPDRPAAPAAG